MRYRAVIHVGREPKLLAVLVATIFGVVALLLPNSIPSGLILIAVGGALGAIIWRTRLVVELNAEDLVLRGSLLFGPPYRIPVEFITAARGGYHLSGVGHGWGRRHEGRGDHMWRASGEEVTLKLADGRRIAFSIDDPTAFLTALGVQETDVAR
ncbi:hypothetical protein [Tessaracoccus sp. OH4464_COT-324]|uniref:hypothetical protein n=1 Tax=Tessaracoccus sp. OH4464_COT-324 TaxID=2491059 RepID=UPI000F62D765|nr:hypothetical protein [Tessaracoccus sp. OH4464_COT-324]RRD47824.1 hypothetical protein EII42_00790 [Tessaracoccus sp. OH4464_COT-324]